MGQIFTMAILEWNQTFYSITSLKPFVLYLYLELYLLNGQVSISEVKSGEASKSKEVKCGVKLKALKCKFWWLKCFCPLRPWSHSQINVLNGMETCQKILPNPSSPRVLNLQCAKFAKRVLT